MVFSLCALLSPYEYQQSTESVRLIYIEGTSNVQKRDKEQRNPCNNCAEEKPGYDFFFLRVIHMYFTHTIYLDV